MEKFAFLTEPLTVAPQVKCCINGVDEFVACLSCSVSSSSLLDSPNDDELVETVCNPYITRALTVVQFRVGLLPWARFEFITRTFRPVMAHQIFGPEEVICGYRNLHVKFRFLPNSFHAKINISYTKQRNNPMRGEVADDIVGKCLEWFPHLITDDHTFAELERIEDLTKMFGDTLFSFSLTDEGRSTQIHINLCDRNNEDFIEFHKRFQALIVFYIDAASIIDFSDHNWTYFYIYFQIQLENNKVGYVPVGFCTVYHFRTSARARLSQQFVLPNFQGKGLGKRLLAAVYNYYNSQESIQYMTVESPCEGFTIMRDRLDLQLLISLPEFSKENILRGYSPIMEAATKTLCKMCISQTKHLYLILYCFYSRLNESSYHSFVTYLKREIHSLYRKRFLRLSTSNQRAERLARIKSVVHDNLLINPRIHKDSQLFIKSIKPQLMFLKIFAPDRAT